MDKELLSNESIELLKKFYNGYTQPVSSPVSNACINQLLDHGFIGFRITGYTDDLPPRPVLSDYQITEHGKGYLHSIQKNEILLDSIIQQTESASSQAQSANSIADSSMKLAGLAIKQAEKAEKSSRAANFRSWASFIIAVGSAIGTLLANADNIVHNVQKILSHLNTLVL